MRESIWSFWCSKLYNECLTIFRCDFSIFLLLMIFGFSIFFLLLLKYCFDSVLSRFHAHFENNFTNPNNRSNCNKNHPLIKGNVLHKSSSHSRKCVNRIIPSLKKLMWNVSYTMESRSLLLIELQNEKIMKHLNCNISTITCCNWKSIEPTVFISLLCFSFNS